VDILNYHEMEKLKTKIKKIYYINVF